MDESESLAINLANKGHNLFLTGNAGTGKTYTVCQIVYSLLIDEKRVAVTASTGKAANVLKENLGHSTPCSVGTIHKFSGILDGRYDNDELVKLVSESDHFDKQRQNILNTETVVIDEISLISQRTFTQLEYLFRNVRKEDQPFGGIQIIVSGDLQQLPPVPDLEYGDDGSFWIQSHFTDVFHIIKLTTVYRQAEEDMINAINEVASGEITLQTEQLLQRLQRSLPPAPEAPTHLCALNFDVNVLNARKLCEMEGVDHVYHAKDEGECTGLPGEKTLHLKIGCPVLLIVNLSDQLVNGLSGTVTKLGKDSVEVFFKSIDQNVEVNEFCFTRYKKILKKDVGSRMQIPLKLAFAMTVHRSQGSTINRLHLDCKNLFQYGQLLVGLSRTQTKRGLRVTNFSKKLLMKPPSIISEFLSRPQLPTFDNLSCCINSSSFQQECPISENYLLSDHMNICITSADFDDFLSEDELELIETIDNLEKQVTELEVLYEIPPSLEVNTLLQELIYNTIETVQQKAENEAIEYLLSNSDETRPFVQYVWNKLCILKEKLVTNESISNKMLSEFYRECNKVVTSEEYKLMVRHLMAKNPTPEQYNVVFKLISTVRKHMLNIETEPIRKKAEEEAQKEKGKVFVESVGSIGTIRYIAGWCIHKLKKNRKKKILNSMYNKSKVKEMEKLIVEKELLEHLEATETELEFSSEKESLKEIERKQNIRKGLTNVTDECSVFFQHLDTKVRSLQTYKNLDIQGPNFSSFLKMELNKDLSLGTEWNNLFKTFEPNLKSQEHLLEHIYDKYTRMSIVQLRKEYLQQKRIKKMEATRKQIKMRTEHKKINPCNMTSLLSDSTEHNKSASHKRLQSEIIQNDSFLENTFKKEELITLCKVYDIPKLKTSNTKNAIVQLLNPVILNIGQMPNLKFLTEHLSAETESAEADEPSPVVPSCSKNVNSKKTISCTTREKQPKRQINEKRKDKGKRVKKGQIIKWSCGICFHDASFNSVGCDMCETWFHADCLKIENLDELGDEWFCQTCIEERANEST